MKMTLRLWERPDSYIGKTWEGYVVGPCSQSRDSGCLTRANYETARAALCELPGVCFPTENHWAVGWVQWIAIPLASFKALTVAMELDERIQQYPSLDDDLWSEFQMEEVQEWWTHSNLGDRIELAKEAGASILAARHKWPEERIESMMLERTN